MRRILFVTLALAVAVAGCGGGRPKDSALTIEELSDTTGLSRGAPLLRGFEPYRMANGVLRVRGTLDFPDDTRIQISVLQQRTGALLYRVQMDVRNRRFDSPPIIGARGPLPEDDYRFEVLAHFNDAWQPARVLAETDQGRALRGPGITRGRNGEAAFLLVEERRL
jgi:hypothetical protein